MCERERGWLVKEIDKEDLLRCVVVGVMDLKGGGGGGGGVYLYGVLRERERVGELCCYWVAFGIVKAINFH